MLKLQAGSFEALMLRMCRRYDPKTDSITLGNANTSWAYTRDTYRAAGIGSATDAIFEFAKGLAKLKVDPSEFALLTAVTIFSGTFDRIFVLWGVPESEVWVEYGVGVKNSI